MKKKQRSFDEIHQLASHLGERIKCIEDNVPFQGKLYGKGRILLSISTAMTVIAETPNACLNDEALRAFDRQVEEAVRAIKEWAKAMITPDGSSPPISSDEIPF